jgi:hypothetical protein
VWRPITLGYADAERERAGEPECPPFLSIQQQE